MLEYFIYSYGSQIALLILCAIFGCLGYVIKRLCTKYINDDTKRIIARTVVQYVEQVWKDLHGKDKLHKALETACKLLTEKKIPVTVDEMVVLIEAALAEFNKAFEKPLDAADTSSAVRRIDAQMNPNTDHTEAEGLPDHSAPDTSD